MYLKKLGLPLVVDMLSLERRAIGSRLGKASIAITEIGLRVEEAIQRSSDAIASSFTKVV